MLVCLDAARRWPYYVVVCAHQIGVGGLLFAAAYYVISLFPVLGFFSVYFFRYSFVSDHFQYLASMGPLALVGAAISVLAGRLPERQATWRLIQTLCSCPVPLALSLEENRLSLLPCAAFLAFACVFNVAANCGISRSHIPVYGYAQK